MDVEHQLQYRKYFTLDEYHLVAESAYHLLNWVMKFYKALNARKKQINTKLCQSRIVIDLGFASQGREY